MFLPLGQCGTCNTMDRHGVPSVGQVAQQPRSGLLVSLGGPLTRPGALQLAPPTPLTVQPQSTTFQQLVLARPPEVSL